MLNLKSKIIQCVVVFLFMSVIFLNCQNYKIYNEKEIKEDQKTYTKEKIEKSKNTKEKYEVEDFEDVGFCTTKLNIRKNPDIKSEIVDVLSYGDKVEITGKYKNWFRIKYKNNEYFIYSEYVSKEEPVIETVEESKELEPFVYNGFVNTDVNADAYFLQRVENYYNMIPENIRNNFQNSGWTILVTSNIQGKYGYALPAMANCDYSNKRINIEYKNGYESALIHEFGHFLDYYNGYPSQTVSFIESYNRELGNFLSIHNTHENNVNTSREYFAECFQEIIFGNNVSGACPETYSRITSLF